jgi:hypothetical protein
VVEYAPTGHLYKINLTTHVKTAVPGVTLNNAVGLILTADRQFAFVTEQTSPGRVRKIHLASGVSTVVATGFVAPFFLTWADAAETTLLVPERDPANRITSVDIATGTTHLVIGGLADRPGAIAMINPARMLVHGEVTISLVDFLPFLPAGPLFMGIGFVPFDKVVQSGPNTGLADTTSTPAYFYQVHNAPFGGTLPIMINHPAAAAAGATFYRIKIDGAAHLDTWTDQKWNGTSYVPETLAPVAFGPQQGFFPVRTTPFQYLNPALGSLLNSTNLGNGLRVLEVEFVKVVGGVAVMVATSPIPTPAMPGPYRIRIDNNPCVGVLAAPVVVGVAANPCGLLRYTAPSQTVTMGFTATHPNNFATYSFSLIRGHNSLPAPAVSGATSGPVSAAPGAVTGTVAGLMGSCVNIAAFAESLYVYATAINGWGRQSQYDASDLLAFTLTN